MYKVGEIIVNITYLDCVVIGSDEYLVGLFRKYMDILKCICENHDVIYTDDDSDPSDIISINYYTCLPEKVKNIVEELFIVCDNIIIYTSKTGEIEKYNSGYGYGDWSDTIGVKVNKYNKAIVILDSEIAKLNLYCDHFYIPTITLALLKERYNIDDSNIQNLELIELEGDIVIFGDD